MLRMCAWTRRVWHEGKWLSFEAFMEARFGISTTHGISEAAAEELKRKLHTLEAGAA